MSNEFVNIPVRIEDVDAVNELLVRRAAERAGRGAGALEDSLILRAYAETSDVMRGFLDMLAEHEGVRISAGELQRRLSLSDEQFRGHLGGFTRLWYGPLKQPVGSKWFFYASGSGENGTMEYSAKPEVAIELRRAKDEYLRSRSGQPALSGARP